MKRILTTLAMIYVTIFALTQFVFVGYLKYLILPTALIFLSILCHMLMLLVKKAVYESNHKKYVRAVSSREAKGTDFVKEYNKEVKPLYEETRLLFSNLLKEKGLHREDILHLKQMVDSNLGIFTGYYRDYKFDNDANEIYVKLKNYNLSKSNFEEILSFLKKLEHTSKIKGGLTND